MQHHPQTGSSLAPTSRPPHAPTPRADQGTALTSDEWGLHSAGTGRPHPTPAPHAAPRPAEAQVGCAAEPLRTERGRLWRGLIVLGPQSPGAAMPVPPRPRRRRWRRIRPESPMPSNAHLWPLTGRGSARATGRIHETSTSRETSGAGTRSGEREG